MMPNERLSMDGEDKIDIVALWRVVWSYKYLIVIATGIGGLIAIFLAVTATPSYRAEVSITVVSRGGANGAASLVNQLGGLASLVGVNLGSLGGSTGAEAQAILRSRQLIEEFIKRNNLLPELSAGAKLPLTLWFAVKRLREGVLSIVDDKCSGLTIVSVTWTDPVIAARWANQFVSLANELLRLRAINESKANITYLNEQIAKANSVEIQRVMYSLVENETKTLMLANAKAEYAFTVVDPAISPEQRFRPRRMLMVLLGLLLGGLVGTMASFALHMLRQQRSAVPIGKGMSR